MLGSRFRQLAMIVGLTFLIISLPYSYLLFFSAKEAKRLDGGESLVSAGPCLHPLSDVELGRTVLADKESVSLRVTLTNDSGEECTAEVTLGAPAFEVDPSQKTRTVKIPPGNKGANLVWVITPKTQGLHEIAVEAGYDSLTKGVSVTNILGLTPKQAQLLSYMGTFLGGPVTLAGLYSQWMKYQSERKEKKEGEQLKVQEAQRKAKRSAFDFINRLRNRS